MKRTFTNIITLIFIGFLLIGVIGAFQNIVQDLQKSFCSTDAPKKHILDYHKG